MKYLWFYFVFLFAAVSVQGAPLDLELGAEGAILINAKTGAILYAKNAHLRSFPASTTKVATALYTLKLKEGSLEERVIAKSEAIASITPQAKVQSNFRSPPYWLETDGGHIGIKKGEEFVLRDLLYAVLLPSANDASNVVAEHVGGTIPKFMEGVNRYLKEIGCRETHFNNPHGLHHPEHFTTPYDMALLACEAMKNKEFRKIVSTVNYTCPQTNFEHERALRQTNKLLRGGIEFYSKAVGVKTGTTQAAGKNLVAAAEENGRLLIAVLFGYKNRALLYQDTTKLFETAFNQKKMRRYLIPKGAQSLTTKVVGSRKKLRTWLPEGLYYDFYPAEDIPVKARVTWSLPDLPIPKGAEVGYIQVVDAKGSVLEKTPLIAFEELKSSFWHRFKSSIALGKRGGQLLFWILMGAFVFFIRRRIYKRKRKGRLY